MTDAPPPLDFAMEPELVGGPPTQLAGTIPSPEEFARAFFPDLIGADAAEGKQAIAEFWSLFGVHKVQWTIQESGPDNRNLNSGNNKIHCICGSCFKLITEAGPLKGRGFHVTRIHHHVNGCRTRHGCNMPHTFGASTLRWPAEVLERGIFQAAVSQLKSQDVKDDKASVLIDFTKKGDKRHVKDMKDCGIDQSELDSYILRVLCHISHHFNMSQDVQCGLLFIKSAAVIFGGTVAQHPHCDVCRCHQTETEQKIWNSFRDVPGHHPPATVFVPFEACRSLHLIQGGSEESAMKIRAGTASCMRGDCPHGGVAHKAGDLHCAGHFHLDSNRHQRMENTVSCCIGDMPKFDHSLFSPKDLAKNKAELKRQLANIEAMENENAAKKNLKMELVAKKEEERKKADELASLHYVGPRARSRKEQLAINVLNNVFSMMWVCSWLWIYSFWRLP
jgi:hypothetical protein